jgi:hypothetical protein
VCPGCAAKVKADFPEGVDQPVQYGANLVGLALYLQGAHLIPFARTAQILGEVTGARFCQGTLHNALKRGFDKLTPFESDLKAALAQAPILHADETSVRQSAKRHWIHTRCTDKLTYLFAHARRGGAPVLSDLIGYRGTLVSDFWSGYVGLDCKHQFCVAHLCRELQGVFELTKQGWARDLKELLLTGNELCHAARARGEPCLWDAPALSSRYAELVSLGFSRTPLPKRGSSASAWNVKALNLLKRLWKYRSSVIGFLFDLSLPFSNNESERSIRMAKVRAKVCGGFRRESGLVVFCRLRSYIQTCSKQGLNVLECLRSLFCGQLVMPSLNHA